MLVAMPLPPPAPAGFFRYRRVRRRRFSESKRLGEAAKEKTDSRPRAVVGTALSLIDSMERRPVMNDNMILITGGAGFIGSHLADELLENGYRVRVLDSLDPQVHGETQGPPDYLSAEVEFIRGDVRDRDVLTEVLKGVSGVIHLAAAVGVGQSMYEIAHYTSVNDLGTAILLEVLASQPVEKVVVASSMSVYGEGLYRDAAGQTVAVDERKRAQLAQADWEIRGEDGKELMPVPTPESKVPEASSIYALSKFVQERQCLIWGEAYQVPTTALRFFNAYGPRQALSNPYTGVLAIFASRYLSGKRPLVYEDGFQQRDFVNVHDVAQACRLALESPRSGGEVFNIGSGQPVTIREIADEMAGVLNCEHLEPEIIGKYRVGDIRHCFADISKAQRLLGYEPSVSFPSGLSELAEWLVQQEGVDAGGVQLAKDELVKRGLVV